MTIANFEPGEFDRGVLALESISVPDWGGLFASAFDTTNTADVLWEWQPRATPMRDVNATLREAADRYDNLLRRLAD